MNDLIILSLLLAGTVLGLSALVFIFLKEKISDKSTES